MMTNEEFARELNEIKMKAYGAIIERTKDWDNVKDEVIPKLIGVEEFENYEEEKRKSIAAADFGSFKVLYMLQIAKDESSETKVATAWAFLDQWGISLKELHDQALANLRNTEPILFGISGDEMGTLLESDVLEEFNPRNLLEEEGELDDGMYALSNEKYMNGAAWILDGDLMEEIADRFNDDMWVIPSSKHEVLLMPMRMDEDPEVLKGLIKMINNDRDCIDPKDKLSDDLCWYSREKRGIFKWQ